MNVATKSGMASLSVAAIGGVAYSGYYHFSKDRFADKLRISLLNLTGKENATAWGERFKELEETGKALKKEINANKWEELQAWCNNQSITKFNKEEDTKYQNFKSFCTWKIGDKLEGKIPANTEAKDSKWEKAHSELKKKNKEELPKDLQEIHDLPERPSNEEKKSKMHAWCTSTYKKIWISEKDEVLVKDICKAS